MTPDDFEPTHYLLRDGADVRVYRDRGHWFADVLESGHWRALVHGAPSAYAAQWFALDKLGLLAAPDDSADYDYPDDALPF